MKKLSFFLMAMLLAVTNAWGETADVKFSSLYSTNTTLDGTAITITDGITATFNKRNGGTATQYYTNGTAVRWYGGGNLNITSTIGNITAITITYTQTANSVNSNPAGYTLNNKSGNWTGDATSVTFTQSGTSGHCRISQIAVTYTTSGSVELKETLTDEQFAWDATKAEATMPSTFENEPTLINILDLDVTYTSSNANVAKIDASTGAITLVAAGTTTISAFYEGGDDAGEGKVYAAKTVSYTLTVKPAPLVIEPIEGGIIDILTHDCLTANSSNYAVFSSKQAKNDNHSDAVYAGRSSRNGNDTQYSIQLNTIDKGRIATTTTGGLAKRVYVRWATQGTLNTDKRSLYIYGSNDAFTGSETTDPSTKIGTVTFTTGAEEAYADLTGDYKHILITGSGAIYMDEIQVTWVSAEGTVVTPTISGDAEFIESTEVTISAEDGLKVYYTLDGTDPTNASTEYTAPFELTATTTVKAVAYDGENASDIISKTFKQLQVLTCEEAAELCAATESADKYVIRGYVTNIATAWSDQYSNISFWMADTKDGGKVFEAFRVQPIIAAEKSVKVGDYVEVIGKIVLYGTTPETSAGGTYTIIPAPVVNHTITVSANPAEAGTVTGGGEFEETDEITVKAVANEGYEFVNWTECDTVVSTEANYSFEVLADRALVANFKEAEPEIEWVPMELEITNLVTEVMEVEGAKFLQLMGRDDMNDADVILFLNNYADVDDDYVVNAEYSYMTFGGLELTVIEGVMTQTSETAKGTIYEGIVRTYAAEEEMYVEFALTMYAAPTTVLVLTDAIVAVNEKLGTLTFDVATGEGEGYYVELAGYTAPGVHEGPQICLFETPEVVSYTNYAETSVADGIITLKGEFTSPNGPKFDLTISGTLPVVEPEVIAYELNGGELPTATVPTQDSLIAAFKDGYNAYFGVSVATTRAIDNFLYAGATVNDPKCDVSLFMKDDASSWKWLGDYVLAVTNAQIEAGTLSTLKELATELMWRQSLTGFFLQQAKLDSNYKGNADFTEAGKPEAWGTAYEAAHEVVLPTEPVAEDYVLPTPVKEGYKFVGWYDNAEGTGEPYTVIPAGWSGTLYAIWEVQGPTTALDNINTTVAPVKAIVNGQLIIIKNGVQYNAQGQVVK